ncbi:hypothetical protein [Paraburkholderia sp. J8-2]|uniref:hypothetical protein n=1 Tax=Paraburkholderia sp. J8-2 TaxID=2805440 RepID=UPI002AB7F20D|nr:hypothetical protein [Paraburkholderia sp. J8-2]
MPIKAHPAVSDSPADTRKFRPTSKAEYGLYAQSLARLTGLPLQSAQGALCRIYGYSTRGELNATLAKSGTAGPFENERAPLTFRPGHISPRFERAVASARAIVVEHLNAIGRAAPPWRLDLIAHLGLFTTPDVHRRCVARVKEVLRAIEELGYDPDVALPLVGYQCAWSLEERELKSFTTYRDRPVGAGLPEFLPARQLESLREYHVARLVEDHVQPVEPHPLAIIGGWVDDGPATPSQFEHLLLSDRLATWVKEMGATSVLYDVFPISDNDDDAEDAKFDALVADENVNWPAICQFMLTPNEAVLQGNQVLQQVNDPMGLARYLRANAVTTEARRYLDNVANTQLVFQITRALPDRHSKTLEAEHLELYVHLKPSASISHDARQSQATFWEFAATGVIVSPRKRSMRPIALLQGVFIVPFDDHGHEARPWEIRAGMEEHSPWLASLADGVDDAFNSLVVAREGHSPGSTSAADFGILIPTLELASGLPEQEVAALFLTMLQEALRGAHESCWPGAYSASLSRPAGDLNPVYRNTMLAPVGMLVLEDRGTVREEWYDALAKQLSVDTYSYPSLHPEDRRYLIKHYTSR